jgi:uncharacterized protein (TIGR03437 family)
LLVRSICFLLLGYSLTLTSVSADPQLAFKNLFGGSASSTTNAIAIDAQGSLYVTAQGVTVQSGNSRDVLTSPPVLVEKWNSAGDKLIYSKTFGGSAFNVPAGIAVDTNGSAYIVGYTTSSDFPVTANAYQSRLIGDRNAFVVKLSADGSQIVYATLLGGGSELPAAIAVDSSGAAYLTGSVVSGFPTTANAFQRTPGSKCASTQSFETNFLTVGDAFVAKLGPDGASLIYASYLGGSCGETGAAILLNADGSTWLAGTTYSTDFPATPGSLQPIAGGGFSDGFLARVSAAGDRLEYSTFVGGSGYDQVTAIGRDAQGNLFLTGSSQGLSQPASPGAFQSTADTDIGCSLPFGGGPPLFRISGKIFIMKLNPQASALTALTYLGGLCLSQAAGIAVDGLGSPWIVGSGASNFPTSVPLFLPPGGGIISQLSPDFTQLLFSTPFDAPNAIAIDSSGAAYVTGSTPLSGVPNGPTAAYAAKIIVSAPAIALDGVGSASPFASITQTGGIAPGKVIRLEGRGIGPAAVLPGLVRIGVSGNGVIQSTAGGVQVLFDQIAAPLLYVSATEIEVLVPFELADRAQTTMQVIYNGVMSNAVPAPVQKQAPEVLGLFNADFTPNSATNPAKVGDEMILYLTGAGQTSPVTTDGEVYNAPLPLPLSTITIGPLPIMFAAPADGLAGGIFQVNFVLTNAGTPVSVYTLSTGVASTNFLVHVK